MIAQGVHAAVAVNWKYRDDPLVYEYCSQESVGVAVQYESSY